MATIENTAATSLLTTAIQNNNAVTRMITPIPNFGGGTSGSTPPTTGQLWPRGTQ